MSLRDLDLEGRIDHFSWLYEEQSGFVSQEDREYFWGKGLSNSGLSKVRKSIDHYFYDEWIETQAMVVGSATHTYILEPEKFDRRYRIGPAVDRRTKAGKEEWKAFEESLVRDDGKPIKAITDAEMGGIVNMKKSIDAHPLAGNLFKNGIAEETIVWNDSTTGCLMKGKLDWRRPEEKLIVDLKTTKDGSPESLARSMFSYRYHTQYALYLDGVISITGEQDYRFLFVFVEKFPPYAVSVVEMDQDAYNIGHRTYIEDVDKVTKWLDLARERVQDGDVSYTDGYSEDIILIETPKWMMN
tara:strand:- start:5441 stop:6337 length:897 start_codon:yes stop_codon:yes gene_type:complete